MMGYVEHVAFMNGIQISVQNSVGGTEEKRTLETDVYIGVEII
jgi:hypothetical protein